RQVARQARGGVIPLAKPCRGALVSRSASELDSAPLCNGRWPARQRVVKPDNDGEATGASTRRTFRGGWRRRARTDRPRNLGDPARAGKRRLDPRRGGEDITFR